MLPVRGRPPFQSRNDLPEMASRELGNGPNALHHNSQKRYRVNFGSPLSAVEHAVLPPTLTKNPCRRWATHSDAKNLQLAAFLKRFSLSMSVIKDLFLRCRPEESLAGTTISICFHPCRCLSNLSETSAIPNRLAVQNRPAAPRCADSFSCADSTQKRSGPQTSARLHFLDSVVLLNSYRYGR